MLTLLPSSRSFEAALSEYSQAAFAIHRVRSRSVTGNAEIMTAREVKSHSSIDRFPVVFHSPAGMAETGPLTCRSEKTGRAAKCSAHTESFLRSGLTMKTRNWRGFRAIFGEKLVDFSALQTAWRSAQSRANPSPPENSLLTGIYTGNLRILERAKPHSGSLNC
jgi:hypothetical protein